MEKIQKYKENKEQSSGKFSTMSKYSASIIKITLAVALFFIGALLIHGAGIVVENGALNISNNLLIDTNTLFVDSASGNVGIGTTAPGTILNYAASGTVLQVNNSNNNARITGIGTTASLDLIDSNATPNQRWFTIYNNEGKAYIRALSDDANTATDMMTFNLANGNVGIGTTSPGMLLDLNEGQLRVSRTGLSAGLENGIFISTLSTQGATDDIRQELNFRFTGGTAPRNNIIGADNDNAANSSDIYFAPARDASGGPVERMRILGLTGHVGIGTSSPNATLTIKTGGTTIADSWDVRSDRDLKDQIDELNVSTFDFSTAKLYSYKLKYNEINPETNQTEQKLTRARVGLMQDEIPMECRVGDAVDTYCLLALAYVKIAQLETEINALKP